MFNFIWILPVVLISIAIAISIAFLYTCIKRRPALASAQSEIVEKREVFGVSNNGTSMENKIVYVLDSNKIGF